MRILGVAASLVAALSLLGCPENQAKPDPDKAAVVTKNTATPAASAKPAASAEPAGGW